MTKLTQSSSQICGRAVSELRGWRAILRSKPVYQHFDVNICISVSRQNCGKVTCCMRLCGNSSSQDRQSTSCADGKGLEDHEKEEIAAMTKRKESQVETNHVTSINWFCRVVFHNLTLKLKFDFSGKYNDHFNNFPSLSPRGRTLLFENFVLCLE